MSSDWRLMGPLMKILSFHLVMLHWSAEREHHLGLVPPVSVTATCPIFYPASTQWATSLKINKKSLREPGWFWELQDEKEEQNVINSELKPPAFLLSDMTCLLLRGEADEGNRKQKVCDYLWIGWLHVWNYCQVWMEELKLYQIQVYQRSHFGVISCRWLRFTRLHSPETRGDFSWSPFQLYYCNRLGFTVIQEQRLTDKMLSGSGPNIQEEFW